MILIGIKPASLVKSNLLKQQEAIWENIEEKLKKWQKNRE